MLCCKRSNSRNTTLKQMEDEEEKNFQKLEMEEIEGINWKSEICEMDVKENENHKRR